MKYPLLLYPLLTLLLPSVPLVSSYVKSSIEENPHAEDTSASLQRMSFDIGYGTEYFDAYVQPSIETFTKGNHSKVQTLEFNGHAVKFYNMSPNPVHLYWVNDSNEPVFMGRIRPFHSSGTGSFPNHRFFIAPTDYDRSKSVLQYFVVDAIRKTNHYYYDPITVPSDEAKTNQNLARLTLDELTKYNIMKRTRDFDAEYLKFTGREYMTVYPRPKPMHFMWPAEYFGQEHWVTSKETQFHTLPEPKLLKPIREHGVQRVLKESDPRILQEYRSTDEYLNMTVKVLSCAPRVYEIGNFLSDVEVDYIANYAKRVDMSASSTGSANEKTGSEKKTRTRTSYNTWVARETDQIYDAIYRRAADLLRIDEALFRQRDPSEHSYMRTRNTVAEQLQLVHYDKYQEYTAHHDFGYAAVTDRKQPARFATLLLYLNDVEEGGETEFPRWVNGETSEGLFVKPQKGKAALFYSFLPDGNLDDLSQHAAKPVIQGEKYLINLWVRDPDFEFSE